MMVNTYCKCLSYMILISFIGINNLAIILKTKLDRVMYSCLLMEVKMVNKFFKFISYISNGFEKSGGGMKNLIIILSRKRVIILTKTLTSLMVLKKWFCGVVRKT